MPFKMVTAYIRMENLAPTEERLRQRGAPGVSVSRVKGFGEHANFFRGDWCTPHARVEVLVEEAEVPDLVSALLDGAHTGLAGDGIIAVLPVEAAYRIREMRPLDPAER